MAPLLPGTSAPMRNGQALWVKLRVQPQGGNADTWQLEVPLPIIDHVTIYQQTAAGDWVARSAGDRVPRADWPQSGRYPFFRLQLQEGTPSDIYLQVRHSTPLALPLRIVTSTDHYHRTQWEYLGLGLLLGAMALLVCVTLLRSWLLRDAAYGWYALYAGLAMLALAAFTGVAGQLLWRRSITWADAAPGCLAVLGAGVAMILVGNLTGAVSRMQHLGRAVQWVGAAALPVAGVYLAVDRVLGISLIGLYFIVVAGLTLFVAGFAWRRGDPVGRWMLLGAVPLAVSVLVALGRSFGWIDAFWLTEYALVLALTVDLPMLRGALNARSSERRGAELRQLASSSQDPLTGMLKNEPFVAKLTQALSRFHRRGEGAAIAVIELTNYEWIKKSRGAQAAEECLLRSVIKLRRLVRDVDTTGRVGENRFGLILEGVQIPKAVNTVASRLIASGLMDEPGRPRDAQLDFHIAAVLLKDYAPAAAPPLMEALSGVLAGMSPRTNRPFRFFDPSERRDAGDSSGKADESQPSVASAH